MTADARAALPVVLVLGGEHRALDLLAPDLCWRLYLPGSGPGPCFADEIDAQRAAVTAADTSSSWVGVEHWDLSYPQTDLTGGWVLRHVVRPAAGRAKAPGGHPGQCTPTPPRHRHDTP